jgi:hypothetical protein
MSKRIIGLGVVGAAVLAIAGCGGDGAEEEALGSAEIQITQVPADVSCIRIVAAGSSRVSQQSFDVAAGQSSVLAMQGLPTGAVTFSGDAFPTPCSQVGSMSTPTYIADPVVAQVQLPQITQVTLPMRRNGRAGVSVDFETDATCAGQACMSDAECCAGTSCQEDGTGVFSCQANACQAAGSTCSMAAPCCAGLSCVGDATGVTTCQTAGMCGGQGAACDPATGTGCCAGLVCQASAAGVTTCQTASMCQGQGQPCMVPGSASGCCAGLTCVADPTGQTSCQTPPMCGVQGANCDPATGGITCCAGLQCRLGNMGALRCGL